MKKRHRSPLFLILFCVFFGWIIYSYLFIAKKEVVMTVPPTEFVHLEENHFVVKDSLFFPIALNYRVGLRGNQKELWPYPSFLCSPRDTNRRESLSKASSLAQLENQMKRMKKMGFNTIRILGIGEYSIDSSGRFSVPYYSVSDKKEHSLCFKNHKKYKLYLDALALLFETANKADLKVIFLLKMNPYITPTETFLQEVAYRFRNTPTVMAYDFFNVPLYFDSLQQSKEDIYYEVKYWNEILKTNAPYQLSTVGLAGVQEIFRWDPNILTVDFISYYPYSCNSDQFIKEMYWYEENTDKPWIIGKTVRAMDKDSIFYRIQVESLKTTLKQAYDYGAIGYLWEQFNRKGITEVKGFTMDDTVKPLLKIFKNFKPTTPRKKPLFLPNYSRHTKFRLKGKVEDEKGNPIKGAIVLGWNQYRSDSSSRYTVTNEDGSFTLRSSFKLYHWMVSAVEKSKIRGEVSQKRLSSNTKDSVSTIDLGVLRLEDLDFLKE